jgi:hypothetical protein
MPLWFIITGALTLDMRIFLMTLAIAFFRRRRWLNERRIGCNDRFGS